MKLIASLALIIAACVSPALAEEPHIHGQTVPDWYDPACCSQRDCQPVEDSTIEFGMDTQGNAYARYKPTGNIFYRYQFKLSQDERYHVCINPAAADNAGALCFYDRSGA